MSTTRPPDQPHAKPANPSLILLLHEVEAPRLERAKEHSLPDILFLSLCAVICGCESFNDIEDFGHAKHDWLKQHIELANGIPSHDTLNRVFQILAPRTFQDCLIRWTEGVRKRIPGEVVAVDGKAQRRARNKNENLQYIVNAWAGENRRKWGQWEMGSGNGTSVQILTECRNGFRRSECCDRWRRSGGRSTPFSPPSGSANGCFRSLPQKANS